MKRVLFLLLTFVFAGVVSASEVSEVEAERLKREVENLLDLYKAGKVEKIVDQTHIAVFEVVGGKDAFLQITRNALAMLKEAEIEVVSAEVSKPTEIHDAGGQEVCFVPKISIVVGKGLKMKSTGFMIAAREKGDAQWKYLDGAGLKKNPQLLWKFFPKLDRSVKLPPRSIEVLNE